MYHASILSDGIIFIIQYSIKRVVKKLNFDPHNGMHPIHVNEVCHSTLSDGIMLSDIQYFIKIVIKK